MFGRHVFESAGDHVVVGGGVDGRELGEAEVDEFDAVGVVVWAAEEFWGPQWVVVE